MHNLGGVQSFLQRHRRDDPSWGVRSRFLIYFERHSAAEEPVRGLGLTWRHNIRSARALFAATAPWTVGMPMLYYNFWGVPFFADLDGATRRIGYLHSRWPGLEHQIGSLRGLLDGVLCISEPLRQFAAARLPELGADRVFLLPTPVDRRSSDTIKPPLAGRRLVLGYSGRMIKEAKRVDRLPALVEALDNAKLNYELHLVGDGPSLPWLRSRLGNHPRTVIHGRLTGERYWDVMRTLDAIVFVSDYEGLPVSLLEALSVGSVPLFPKIGGGGEAYARQVSPDCVYEPNSFSQLVMFLACLERMPQARLQELRDRCGAAVQQHIGDSYRHAFITAMTTLNGLARVSRADFTARPSFVSDLLPFAWFGGVSERGLWRANAPPSSLDS